MHWSCVLEQDGQIIQSTEGDMPNPPLMTDTLYAVTPRTPATFDPFAHVAEHSISYPEPPARLSVTVQHALPYGEIKVSFTVSLTCPQTKEMLDYAAEHAFIQATKYVNNSMQCLAPGLPPLPVPTPSR